MTSENKKSSLNHTDFSLMDKFLLQEGRIILSGTQALARLPMDQYHADVRRGLNTATLISGYRGSPLGSLDLLLEQMPDVLKDHNIVFESGVNEELGATAVFGSQIANLLPSPKFDGVLGMWYGKAPGVDRTGDVFKHANYAGVGENGGVLAIAGDDPISKSSTIPSHSEFALQDAFLPVLFPGNVQEILDLGRIGFELSRYCGLWSGFKIVTNVADEFSTIDVAPDRITIQLPHFTYNGKPWKHNQNVNLLTPYSLMMEREIHEGRLEAATLFAITNKINKIVISTPDDWLGIVVAGKAYYDLREALDQCGLSDIELQRHGIRILKINMLYPLEKETIYEFAKGLNEILVVEEKRPFIEDAIRNILYDKTERPIVVGKVDQQGQQLVKPYGELDAEKITEILARIIRPHITIDSLEARMQQIKTTPSIGAIPLISRSPFYCSGCPHNRSTNAPQGSLVAAGIGCHTMTLLIPDREVIGVTQMGGEGAQWVGAAPFTNSNHIFQNLGDGTLFHSGSLAIRQAIASNVNITYKILYNSAVAMTGGQDAAGKMDMSNLTKSLMAEGVKQIIITTNDVEKYRDASFTWPSGVTILHRDHLEDVHKQLEVIPGVTVLIHDQECAAELRRKRRRGLRPDPELRVFINEAVCEGCGDCGKKSNCLSVHPVDTEFGRKTQIHQSSCNKDYSCLDGDCPAFIKVIPAGEKAPLIKMDDEFTFIEPQLPTKPDWNIYIAGMGGTGVVTTNQIMATAAAIEGKFVKGLDQTGLSQKGGPVVSNLRIFDDAVEKSTKVPFEAADCYLVFDLVTAATPSNLKYARKGHTVAVIASDITPTGNMVVDVKTTTPPHQRFLDTIGYHTKSNENFAFNALQLSEALFDNHMQTNLIVVGAAYQKGLIPIHSESIEQSIKFNGVSAKKNIQAFRAGRRAVADPEWLKDVMKQARAFYEYTPMPITKEAQTLIDMVGASGKLQDILKIRVPELIAYQNVDYAKQYVDFVRAVVEKERQLSAGRTELSEAVARYLFKLMAYKDEYEVARLHRSNNLDDTIKRRFGKSTQISYLLHPPFLRALGVKKKISFGKWFDAVYNILISMRFLRGTPFDIFGYAKVRRVERKLISQYKHLINGALDGMSQDNYPAIVQLAKLPDIIRGYEDIKLDNVENFWAEVKQLGF